VPVAGARFLVLSHDGKTLLVLAQDSNTVAFMNTGNLVVTNVNDPTAILDRPISAVFNGNDSAAYIFSCGAECGGAQAKVTTWDRSTNALGATVNVAAAREGLQDGSNLYVAGTDPATGGVLTVLNAGSLAQTKPVSTIADGTHDTILISSGQLFIGARGCLDAVHGCLSIYNTSNGNVIYSAVNPNPGNVSRGDDVTGMEAIPGHPEVYVCEGGALRIYDTSTDALQAAQIYIPGQVVDVREVF
jgi:hypothetical protein